MVRIIGLITVIWCHRVVSHISNTFAGKLFKVAGNPVFSRSTNLESKLIEFFVFVNFKRTVRFGSLHPLTVRKIGDFPHFLSALTSNNQFIIKLVKMWPGGTLHVVVGTLKISLDRLNKNNNKKKNKKKKKEGV